MKTGEVQDRGDGELYLEVDGWTPLQYYVSEEALEPYYHLVGGLMAKLERMPPAVRARQADRDPVPGEGLPAGDRLLDAQQAHNQRS
jgi:hypothetical protein